MSEFNHRGLLQEYEQQRGRAPPTFSTQDLLDRWRVTVKFATASHPLAMNDGVYETDEHKSVCAKKKDAERNVARHLLLRLTTSSSASVPPPQQCENTATTSHLEAVEKQYTIRAYIDVDNAHWVAKIVGQYPQVFFHFYASCGTSPPLPKSDASNYSWVQLKVPGDNLVDAKIIIDVAQQVASLDDQTVTIVVSRDKLLYNLSLLLPNVVYVADEAMFSTCVCAKRVEVAPAL